MTRRLRTTGRGSAALPAACSVACTIAVLGCGESSLTAAAGWDGVVRDSAGIQIVENSGSPLWPEGETWELTEVLRIGVAMGDPEYELGEVIGLAVLSDRRVVVADLRTHDVKFFSPEGIHERTVGTAGGGPGEFGRRPLALFHGPGDTLVVLDQQNARGNTLAPNGDWLGSFPMFPPPVPGGWERWTDEPQTGQLVTRPPRYDGAQTWTVLRRDVHGAVLDTVIHLPPLRRTPSTRHDPNLRGYFPGHLHVILCCGSLVTGLSDEYRLLWYDLDGTLRRIVTLPHEPIELTDEDRAVRMHQLRLWAETRRWSPERLERERSLLRFEETYPAYRNLMAGPASTVLVQRIRPLRDLEGDARNTGLGPAAATIPPGSGNWDVFDREGRYLGVVELPDQPYLERGWAGAVKTRFARDSATDTWYMYSVWRDELDIDYVIGWRIDGPIPG